MNTFINIFQNKYLTVLEYFENIYFTKLLASPFPPIYYIVLMMSHIHIDNIIKPQRPTVFWQPVRMTSIIFVRYTCIHTVYFESTGRRTTGRPSGTCRYYIILTIIYFNLTRLPRLPGDTNSWPKYVYRTKTVPPENFFRTNYYNLYFTVLLMHVILCIYAVCHRFMHVLIF